MNAWILVAALLLAGAHAEDDSSEKTDEAPPAAEVKAEGDSEETDSQHTTTYHFGSPVVKVVGGIEKAEGTFIKSASPVITYSGAPITYSSAPVAPITYSAASPLTYSALPISSYVSNSLLHHSSPIVYSSAFGLPAVTKVTTEEDDSSEKEVTAVSYSGLPLISGVPSIYSGVPSIYSGVPSVMTYSGTPSAAAVTTELKGVEPDTALTKNIIPTLYSSPTIFSGLHSGLHTPFLYVAPKAEEPAAAEPAAIAA